MSAARAEPPPGRDVTPGASDAARRHRAAMKRGSDPNRIMIIRDILQVLSLQ
jgi:hypothetical protein